MKLVKGELDEIVILVSRINALRAKLYHERLSSQERRWIQSQVAAFRVELARRLYEKNSKN